MFALVYVIFISCSECIRRHLQIIVLADAMSYCTRQSSSTCWTDICHRDSSRGQSVRIVRYTARWLAAVQCIVIGPVCGLVTAGGCAVSEPYCSQRAHSVYHDDGSQSNKLNSTAECKTTLRQLQLLSPDIVECTLTTHCSWWRWLRRVQTWRHTDEAHHICWF